MLSMNNGKKLNSISNIMDLNNKKSKSKKK